MNNKTSKATNRGQIQINQSIKTSYCHNVKKLYKQIE